MLIAIATVFIICAASLFGQNTWRVSHASQPAQLYKSSSGGGLVAWTDKQAPWGAPFGSFENVPDTTYIMKFNANGDVQWQRAVGVIDAIRDPAIQEYSDGSILFAGFVSPTMCGDVCDQLKGSNDILLIKYGSNGNTIWKKVIGSTGYDYFETFITTGDGGLVIQGRCQNTDGDFAGFVFNSYWPSNARRFIMKLNAQGEHCDLLVTNNPDGVTVSGGQQATMTVAAS
jgi:hypothetical protein